MLLAFCLETIGRLYCNALLQNITYRFECSYRTLRVHCIRAQHYTVQLRGFRKGRNPSAARVPYWHPVIALGAPAPSR